MVSDQHRGRAQAPSMLTHQGAGDAAHLADQEGVFFVSPSSARAAAGAGRKVCDAREPRVQSVQAMREEESNAASYARRLVRGSIVVTQYQPAHMLINARV
jgi:hypothetical protein